MTFKDTLRLHFGKLFSSPEIKPVFRNLYFSVANIYLSQLDQLRLRGAWIRRSVTTPDFIPGWSDIDVTLLIDDRNLHSTKLKNDILVKDLQIVGERFYKSWSQAGGLRNRQFKSWIPLISGPTLLPTRWNDREVISFELVHEIHLLYSQLEKKLHSSQDEWSAIAIEKLKIEIERLRLYWQDLDSEFLFCPRINIELPENFFQRFDEFLLELSRSLHPDLQNYEPEQMVLEQVGPKFTLALEINSKPVVAFTQMKDLKELIAQNPRRFVCTLLFVKLIKAVGVQEQTLVNELARDRSSYYFHYNLQRLATDLIGAFHLFPLDERTLYFCFKNINEFLLSVANAPSPFWAIIEEKWTEKGHLPLDSHDLRTLVQANLDVLASLS